jgi:type II secretory pathway pseudopilin PulG
MTESPIRGRGFTLLETLLALGMIGAILAVAVTLLGDVADARDRIETRLRRAEGATLALELLADRLATATLTAIDGTVGISGDALSLRITGCGVASIRLLPGASRSPLLDRATLEAAWQGGGLSLRDDGAAWSTLAPDLVAVRFRYHDGTGWRDEWNGDRDGLPHAIEVAIWESPWPEGLVPSWMPDPETEPVAETSEEFDTLFDDLEGFAPPPMPASDDQTPTPDRQRVIAILDPAPSTSSRGRDLADDEERPR